MRAAAKEDAAIHLAYVHNLGDTLVSLIPVAAGIFIFASGNFLFDSLFALLIAAVVVITTLQAVVGSHQELLWLPVDFPDLGRVARVGDLAELHHAELHELFRER
jgi:Co/Zn/Cd efflux system component